MSNRQRHSPVVIPRQAHGLLMALQLYLTWYLDHSETRGMMGGHENNLSCRRETARRSILYKQVRKHYKPSKVGHCRKCMVSLSNSYKTSYLVFLCDPERHKTRFSTATHPIPVFRTNTTLEINSQRMTSVAISYRRSGDICCNFRDTSPWQVDTVQVGIRNESVIMFLFCFHW